MKMELIKTDYYCIYYRKSARMIYVKWLPTTDRMPHEVYRQHLKQAVDLVVEYKAYRLLVDSRLFFFVINPEIQAWADKTLAPIMVKAGLRRSAIVLPHSIFAEMSVRQMVQEPNSLNFEIDYFTTPEDALQWL